MGSDRLARGEPRARPPRVIHGAERRSLLGACAAMRRDQPAGSRDSLSSTSEMNHNPNSSEVKEP